MCRIVFLTIALLACSTVNAQDAFPTQATDPNYNWKLATLGGTQYWTDVRIEGGWHVQRNCYFGHFRLVDDSNVRQTWGSEEACNAELEKQILSGAVKPYSGKVVILLHGLLRTWKSMKPMADHLNQQGYQTIFFRYASSRERVGEHAKYLRDVIDKLPPTVTEINFIGHSLGNIVVRHYVSDCNQAGDFESAAFKLIGGASGAELSLGWDVLSQNLATPEFEFGIIAGGYGDDQARLNNFLLPGTDDFTVSCWETMLPGADDFLVRHLVHSTMMRQTEVLEATTLFLQNGYFISAESKRPIESLPENPHAIEKQQ